jgi:hypothetical protein
MIMSEMDTIPKIELPIPPSEPGVDIWDRVQNAWKAVYAGLLAAVTALGAILVGDETFADVTSGQWTAIVVAFLLGLGGTYAITNKKLPGQ